MKDRLTELLEKYWIGKTSLQEEAELKLLLKKSGSYPELTKFFSGVEKLALLEPGAVRIPERKSVSVNFFLRIAAVFVALVVVAALFYNDHKRSEQERAYMQVMEAFALIQSNMEKGSEELQVLDQLRHLNMTNELFNINELNEQ